MTANEMADEIQERMNGLNTNDDVRVFDYAAAELRRLHQVNAELLEALKEITEWTERYTLAGHPISTAARAAIAKATGESNE